MVADGDRVDHHAAGGTRRRPLPGGAPGDHRGPLHQGIQAVVVPGDAALRDPPQRAARLRKDLDRAFERLAVEALAVDAEDAGAGKQEALHRALHEEVPARHYVDVAAYR